MFFTHPSFRHQLQLEGSFTQWRAVGLMFDCPLFALSCRRRPGDEVRCLLVSTEADVRGIVEQEPCGAVIGMVILIPPDDGHVPSAAWKSVAVSRIEALVVDEGCYPEWAFVGSDGERYFAFPKLPIDESRARFSTIRTFELMRE